jgi:hypothetical protein
MPEVQNLHSSDILAFNTDLVASAMPRYPGETREIVRQGLKNAE